MVYPQHLKEEHSNVHYFVTGNGNFFNALEEHKWKVKSSLKYFNGQTGAFTLLEATPDFLMISQIDDRGRQVYQAKLLPRTSSQPQSDAENTILDEFFTSQT